MSFEEFWRVEKRFFAIYTSNSCPTPTYTHPCVAAAAPGRLPAPRLRAPASPSPVKKFKSPNRCAYCLGKNMQNKGDELCFSQTRRRIGDSSLERGGCRIGAFSGKSRASDFRRVRGNFFSGRIGRVPGQNGHLQRRNDTEPKRGPLYTTAIGKGDAGSGERHRETQAWGSVIGRRRLGGEL